MKEINLHSSGPLLIQSVFHESIKAVGWSVFYKISRFNYRAKAWDYSFQRAARGGGLMDGGRDANSRFLITNSAAPS